jgi:uncharacterized protein (DUF4415 family)
MIPFALCQPERQIDMSAKDSKKRSKTDWDRLAKMSDKDIDYTDIPPVDENFFKTGKLHLPKAKSLISIRIDQDILEWFKTQGPGIIPDP